MNPGPPQVAQFPDGRLHLQHGPIDLLIEAFATDPVEVECARQQAVARFGDILQTLVAELPLLRTALNQSEPELRGPIARRMLAACWPHRAVFITPMAAVAGAVADEVLTALVRGRSLQRAYVNNGGDIALHLAQGESFRVGLAGIEDARLRGMAVIRAEHSVRGIATSGWRGRSQSLGIADAVTILARDAAAADAAATLVANAVNVDHPAVRRLPARAVRDDSDLGDLPVTVAVGSLPPEVVHAALESGMHTARRLQRSGLIHSAYLRLQGEVRVLTPVHDGAGRAALLTEGEHQ